MGTGIINNSFVTNIPMGWGISHTNILYVYRVSSKWSTDKKNCVTSLTQEACKNNALLKRIKWFLFNILQININ